MKHFTTKTKLARAAMTLLVALLTTATAWAQETLTVYDGTDNSSCVPFYGLYADTQGTASECVIPSDELTAMVGGTITAMKFYLKTSAAAAWTGTHQVYIGEVNATTLTGITGPNLFTVVKTASFDATGTELTVEFDEPYTYDGGNLLIGTYVSVAGNYKSASFYGVTQTENTGWYRSSASATGTGVKFIPKTTFTYEPSSGVAFPATFEATNVTAHEATLTWTGGTSTYNVEYKKKADTDWTPALANTSLTTHTLTGLTPNTDYQARVQSVGTNDVSGWRTINFKTPISCPAPTDLTVTLTPGNGSVATLSWTENGTATQWEICLNNDDENLRTVTSGQCSMANGQWSIELTGLTAEQAYTAKIRAVNSADDKSEWTDAISFTPTNAYLFTVNNGTTTSKFVPVYGYYADYSQRAEFIIPASELEALRGKALKSMKFYANYNFTFTGSFQVYIREVSEETFSGTNFYTAEGATTVYTGTVTVSSTNGMTINFSEDFNYGDGNLLVGFYQANGGNCSSSGDAFYGVEATGTSISSYGSSNKAQCNFLPKVTFGYLNNPYKKPKNLTLGTITINTATIGWTAPADDITQYQYQYKPEGGSWTELTSTTELAAAITGLTANTTYTFQVKAIYSDGESDFASTTFTTECNAFSIPYTFGFEDANDMRCWTISDVDGRTIIDNGSTFNSVSARTGDNFFVFEYKDYPDTDPQYMTLITPEFTGIADGLRVEFYYRTDRNYEETFRVGYSTTDNNLSSFTWGSPTSSTATEYQLFKANYPVGTKYVAVQHLSDDKNYLILDDFSFTEAPSCLEPSTIQASGITTTSANLSWTAGGSETAWDIYLTDDLADVPDDGTTPTYAGVNSNVNYPISGLVSGAVYYVYIRSACDATAHSGWSNRATFNTVCEGLALPYSYNFEDDALPVCWTTISTDEGWNIFTISDTDPQQGSKHLNLHCLRANEYQYVVLPEVDANYPVNEYEITFYSKLAGTTTTDRTLAVGVMTDPTDDKTFVQVGEAFTPTTAYAQYKVRFNTYTGNGQYIAIKHTITNLTNNGETYIDNLEVNHLPSCIEPEGLAASNITGHTADLSWTGYSDAYNVDYRTAAYVEGSEENFSTNPDGWIYRTGKLNVDGTATLSGTSSWSRGNSCSVFDSHIYMNLYSTKNNWLITPSMTIKDGDALGFDVAYTKYSSSGANTNPVPGCESHRFAVLISTDEMATWTILREWNNSGSEYILDDISKAGEAISPIDLSAYAGATAYIVFFGHSEVTNYDNNLHFDNVVIGTPIAEGEWQTATADEEHCTLTGLAAETEYEVRVQGDCGSTNGLSEWTEVLSFTTTVACSTPTNVTISNIKNHSAVVSWESGNDQFNLMLGEEVIPNVTNPYTLTNLNPETQYSVKVKSVCGGEDGESEWTAAKSFTTLGANPVPTALAFSNLTTTTVTLSWTENSDDATGWVVAYKTEDDTEYTEITEVTENPYTLTGLTSETVYTAKVCAIQGGVQSDWSSEISFEPTAKTVIGSGTGTNSNLPSNTNYNYSYTQQIYTVEELGEAGVIESIDFYMTSNTDYTRNLDIYMVSTDKNAFENTSDWIAVTDADLVFSGEVNFKANAWTTITLDNVFNYNGTQNVAIIVDDNTGVYSSRSFRAFTATANQALYKYQDGSDIPIDYSSSGTLTTSKNQIRILKSAMGDCMKPTQLTATEVGPDFAKLSWTENGSSYAWVVAYKTGDADFTEVPATAIPFTLSGLTPSAEYTVKVRPACDENLWSREITFTTLADNPVPADVDVSNIKHNSAVVTWTGYSDSYNVSYRTVPTINTETTHLFSEDFEGSDALPAGWTSSASVGTNAWTVGTGVGGATGSDAYSSAHGGTNNAKIGHTNKGEQTYLITPVIDLSGQSDAFLKFWMVNKKWASDINELGVYYRVNGGAWNELAYITEDHTNWTEQTIALTGLAANYQIGFMMYDRYGYNVGLDDIAIYPANVSTWQTVGGNLQSPTATITGLEPETDYQVKVQGVKNEAPSDWSPVATFTTMPEPVDIELANDATNNATTIEEKDGVYANVILTDRELFRDGYWNTLYLPFSVTLAGSPLAGAEARELSSANISGTTLNLNFSEPVNSLTAGTPYIIKWSSGATLTETDLVFDGVMVYDTDKSFDNGENGDARVRFIGTYDQKTIATEDRSVLFLGADNKLYYPDGTNGGVTIGACRAYFKIGEDGGAGARLLTGFNLNFGDETNAVFDLNNKEERRNNSWYSLDGVKLDGKPTKKGLYIHGGKKVVIK